MFRLFFVHFASLLFEWDYSCSLFQFTSSMNSKVRSFCIILFLFCFISRTSVSFSALSVVLGLSVPFHRSDVCILFALLSSNLAPVLQALLFVLIIFPHYLFFYYNLKYNILTITASFSLVLGCQLLGSCINVPWILTPTHGCNFHQYVTSGKGL